MVLTKNKFKISNEKRNNFNSRIVQIHLGANYFRKLIVPFCQMAQRNLPATREETNKGLTNEKVLRRRVGIFWNF